MQTITIRRFALVFLTFGMVMLPTISEAKRAPKKPKLIVVKFHADWCGSCQRMGPVMRHLRNKLDGRSVLFVTLNLTNRTTRHQSRFLAASLGLSKVWKKYGHKTGFALVLRVRDRKVLRRLASRMSLKQMGKALLKFL